MATPSRSAPKRPAPTGRIPRAQSATMYGPKSSPLAGIDTKYHTPIFLGMIFLALLVFFGGVVFSGKLFLSYDFLSWESFRPYISMMDDKGEAPLWMPYIFSGIPGFAALIVTGDRWWDLSMKIIYSGEHVFGVVNYHVMRVVMHYFIYGVGIYLLMRSKKAARSTAYYVSLAAMFSTWIIVYIMIGHNTKILTLMTFPFIFLCLERLIGRWSLLYAGLLILAVHVLWEGSHMQTAFYGACAVGIYLLFELIAALVAKENVIGVLRAGVMVAVAGAFAYGMGMDRNLAVQEYLPYSTRGAPAMVNAGTAGNEEGSQGYQYSTNWSFSPEETITYVIPSYFGWGKLEYTGPETGNQPSLVPTYWGQMPHTDAGHYMGISVLILGLFGAWMNRKNRFVQALMVIGLFGLLLSYGKNFSLLYDLFYNYVPRFSSLRAPSQSLVLLEFVFPLLAGFGIETLLAMRRAGDNPSADKSIRTAAIGFGIFTAIGIMATGLFKSAYISAVAAAPNTKGYPASFHELAFSTMVTDWFFSGILGLATLLLMYFYLKQRVSPTALKLALIAILLFDLWRVDYRPMDAKPGEDLQRAHARTDMDEFMAQDKSLYRMMDVIALDPNSGSGPNFPAFHLQQHVLGYHAAKMRNYQNFLDFTDGSAPGDSSGSIPTSELSWNLLNLKYVIYDKRISESLKPVFQSQQRQGAIVFENTGALPRAWFVNRVDTASDRRVLEMIRDNGFDPRDVAYLKEPLKTPVEPVGYVAGVPAPLDTGATPADTTLTPPLSTGTPARGSVNVTRFEPLHIGIDVEAPGTNFLVISEIHYPPGWKATIDGKPAEIIQTNYLLRGLVVPPGKHKIEMNYVSAGFETGKWTSLGLNLVMFAAIIAGVMIDRKKREEEDPRHDAPVIQDDDV